MRGFSNEGLKHLSPGVNRFAIRFWGAYTTWEIRVHLRDTQNKLPRAVSSAGLIRIKVKFYKFQRILSNTFSVLH